MLPPESKRLSRRMCVVADGSWPLFVHKFKRKFQTQKSTFMKYLVAKNTFISQNLVLNFLSFMLRICMLDAGLGTFATKLTRTLVRSKDDPDTSWYGWVSGRVSKIRFYTQIHSQDPTLDWKSRNNYEILLRHMIASNNNIRQEI